MISDDVKENVAVFKLLHPVVTIGLMALLVAVIESLINVFRGVELHLAVHASELHLLSVKVDALAAKEVKLAILVQFSSEVEPFVLELLGISCLLGLGGISLLLLLDSGRHDFSLLIDRVRMDVPHEVP